MKLPSRVLGLMSLLLLALAPVDLHAQSSTTRGFNLGFHLQGASLTVEGGDASNAGGAGLHVGYGINRRFTLFASLDGAEFDVEDAESVAGTWTMGHFDLGTRFHFANSLSRWVPFLEAAVGARVVSLDATDGDGSVSFSGPAFTLGGGVAFYIKETLALDLDLNFTSGEFTDVHVGGVTVSGFDVDATSTRFGVGLLFWL
jgi:hypothetical protein